jgi:hypothetical protein
LLLLLDVLANQALVPAHRGRPDDRAGPVHLTGGGAERTAKVRGKCIGSREGVEIVQVYVGFPAAEPPLLLRGFEKV